MKQIAPLDETTKKSIQGIIKHDSRHRSRNRALVILLSSEGMRIPELMRVTDCSKRTIYRWFTSFETYGIDGLHEAEGRGRKPALDVKRHGAFVQKEIEKKRSVSMRSSRH